MSFELKFFVCRHVSMWGFQNRVCLSVCPYPEKRNHLSFVNISPTLVIDTSMVRSSWVLQHGNPKIWISIQKSSQLNFDLCWRAAKNVFTSSLSREVKNLILLRENMLTWVFLLSWFVNNFNIYCAHWLGTVFLNRPQHISCVNYMHLYMTASGMHRRPFEGWHLVIAWKMWKICM